MSTTVKEAVLDIAKKLPDECSWEDVMYQMYVRQKIQAGLDDAENGRVVSDEEVFADFGQWSN